MKRLLLFLPLLLCGCGPSWHPRYEPTTDAERAAVVAHAERILAATPASLAGHDQDWADAIAAAHDQAKRAICRPTFWEWDAWSSCYTGRWRYSEEARR